MEDIQEHLKQVHSDPAKDTQLGKCRLLYPEAYQTTPLRAHSPEGDLRLKDRNTR